MKAMILAAGLGTRLQPYTHTIPKALFPIGGKPLLDIAINNLIVAGCDALVMNAYRNLFYNDPMQLRFIYGMSRSF